MRAQAKPFSIHIGTRLVRPLTAGNPVVEVALDGVLFDDLSFYGPDVLHSQRTMIHVGAGGATRPEILQERLLASGAEGLRKEMLLSLARQGDRSQPGVQMVRSRATNLDAEREEQFAFLEIPESPVEASNGLARTGASLAGAPRFEVRNRSNRAVQHLEIGWIVKDQQGREFLAGSMPADLKLAPNQSSPGDPGCGLCASIGPSPSRACRALSRASNSLTARKWIPSRGALDQPGCASWSLPSPEEQRLSHIYTKKGLQALIEELKKF